MRLLVCGSRTYADRTTMWNVLDGVHHEHHLGVLIHGAAAGADSLADEWADENDVPISSYWANWGMHGKAAGPIRNELMLKESHPDLVLAFIDKPLPESRGTAHMCKIARAAGVETFEVGP